MKYIETKSQDPNKDCKECCFANSCIDGCRLKKGWHWESIMDCSL